MATTPLQSIPYPDYSDVVDGPAAFEAALEMMEKRLVMRFANATARDAAISSPEEGMVADLVDVDRLTRYNGSHWTIIAGAMPAVSCTRLVSQSHTSSGSFIDLALTNEIEDSDGFHTGSTGAYTVPVGLGGDYDLRFGLQFATNATGIRSIQALISNNASQTNELSSLQATGAAHATSGVSLSASARVRLEAGAIVSLQGYQNSGGNLNIASEYASLTMVRHLPQLT